MLFTPESHEPLTERAWDEAWVRERIAAIADDTERAVGTDGLWPVHPLDHEEDWPARLGIYLGAAGIAWGLVQLGRPHPELVRGLHARYVEQPDWPGVVPSYLMGEAGILLVSYLLEPSEETASRLARAVEANQDNEALEMLWGAPGTMLAALAMHDVTAEARWAELWRASAERLWADWQPRENGTHLWTQRLYGHEPVYVGAGHGFAGNALALLAGGHLLDDERAAELDRRIVATTTALAVTEDGLANWPPSAGGASDRERRHPRAVVPRLARHRQLPRDGGVEDADVHEAARGRRRADLARRPAREGRRALPRHRRQRPCAPGTPRAHRRPAMARASAEVRGARAGAGRARARGLRQWTPFALDRRHRRRRHVAELHRRAAGHADARLGLTA